MFSNACEYAIKAKIYIANKTESGDCVGVKVIAQGINAPEAYIAKILQQLSKNGLIHSTKGPNGGFSIDKKQTESKIVAIVKLFDPEFLKSRCVLGLEKCDANSPCPMHYDYVAIREKIMDMLNKNTIATFNDLVNENISVLKHV